MNADPNPDRLRRLLRQGDPAAHEPGLSADETNAMRREVLTAAPAPRRQIAWFPVLATGAAAFLALALAVALGPWHRPSVPHPKTQVAAVPAPAPPATLSPVPRETTAPRPQVPVKKPRTARRRPLREPRVLPRQEAPMLVASLPVREIQFSTPGGTRVIWELATKDVR